MSLTDYGTTPENEAAGQEELARRLDEISRLLRRMLVLAELSASGMDVDRQLLQKVFERLRAEVWRIADGIDL